ncbi:MAG: hypothetical protein GTO13_05300 [Proteobacteria bacterium]|nr:hypothetical protein [Pseudomonadota bacterium]
MTHRDEGHYAEKHGARAQLDQAITEAIKRRSRGGNLSCMAAFRIAEEMNIKPSEVGQALDFLEMKIIRCQLGLFGHEKGKRLIVKPAETVSLDLEEALRAGLVNGRLPCVTAWDIAKRFDLPKMKITSACEKLNLRISHCQLGTF